MEKIKFLKVLFLQQKYIVPQQILENARKGFTIKTVYDIIKKSKYTDKRGFEREEERANEMEYIERFKEEGATVEELTDEEVAAFKEAVQPVYDDLRAQIGDELMDRWLATVPQS